MSRIIPSLPPQAFKTFAMSAPLATHFRRATCEEIDCQHYLLGWRTIVPADSPQAAYIRGGSGRRFTEARQPGGLAEFTFEAGQACFAAADHRIRLERPFRFLVASGDWRQSFGQREHTRAEDWVDEFANDLDRVRTDRERG
jgi:hypothetical protein